MSRPLPLQAQFSGMRRDHPRNRMPQNSVWDIVDMIPDYGAGIRERGGWNHHTPATSSVTANGGTVIAGVYASFAPTAGPSRLSVFLDSAGNLFTATDAGTLARHGAVSFTALDQNLVFMGGVAASAATAVYTGLVIIPQGSSLTPQKFDGTSLTALNGSPPKALFAGVYKDYLLLGNGTLSGGGATFPNRVWFSPPGDPDCAVSGSVTAWDTTDSWVDFNDSVFGFGATPTALIVFHRTGISRVRGSVAPPETDFVIDHMWQSTSLLDPFSIVENEGYVYWASSEGIFRTDGVTVEDLTIKGGMSRYWKELPAETSTDVDDWRVAMGVHRGYLFISVFDTTNVASVDNFIVNLKDYSWMRMTNLNSVVLWSGQIKDQDDLFFSMRADSDTRNRVSVIDGIFRPDKFAADGTTGVAAEGHPTGGTAVAGSLETPFYELGRPGLKRVKRVFVGYELRDYEPSSSPTVTVYTSAQPTEGGGGNRSPVTTSIGTLSLTETDVAFLDEGEPGSYLRAALTVNSRGPGIAFKFVKEGVGDFAIHDIGAEVNFQEESKRA